MGLSLHDWENVMALSLAAAALAAAIVGVSTWVVIQLTRAVNQESARQIAELNAAAGKSGERIAALNNETARLQADNLSLQTVLAPRHVGLIGIDGPPKAAEWFAGFERWAGTKILIQVIPGDPEAQNLANEIAIVLSKFGWHPEMIDEKRSGHSMHLAEGISVFSPSSYKAFDPNNEAHKAFGRLSEAAISLARALTNAGLGVGSYPVPGSRGLLIVVDFPPDSQAGRDDPYRFSPPLDGVYMTVGSRPIGLTMQWIRHGRPNELGAREFPTPPPSTGPTSAK